MNQRINKTGELEEPFVELDEIEQRQFNRKGAHHFMKYDDFLKSVDKHFATSLGSLDDQEYEIKVHLKVNKQTLKSTEHKKHIRFGKFCRTSNAVLKTKEHL